MSRVKELLAGGILRDYRFCSMDEFDKHISRLERLKQRFRVIETHECPDGTVLTRILGQYNDSDLIQI